MEWVSFIWTVVDMGIIWALMDSLSVTLCPIYCVFWSIYLINLSIKYNLSQVLVLVLEKQLWLKQMWSLLSCANTADIPNLYISHPWVLPTKDQQNQGEKSRDFQEAKIEFAACQQLCTVNSWITWVWAVLAHFYADSFPLNMFYSTTWTRTDGVCECWTTVTMDWL